VADFDISNTLVSDTFGRLLQIATDNVVYDATGSFLDEFKISGSFTTSEYVEITDGDNQSGNKLHSRDELFTGVVPIYKLVAVAYQIFQKTKHHNWEDPWM